MLEALVRDEPGCADALSSHRRSNDEEEENASAYPSPLLWYEEIRPSDIDAYHTANCRGPSGEGGARLSGDPLHESLPSNGSRAAEPKRPDARGGGTMGLVEGGVRQPAEAVLGQEAETRAGVAGPRPSVGETPPSAKSRGPGPHDNATGTHEERRREGGGAVARTEPWKADGHGWRCSDSPVNNGGCFPPIAMSPAATTTPPPDPSQTTQATQTAFLPGLPSQVLVTQERDRDQQHGGTEWEARSEGDESSQKEEEDAAASSESDSPFPRNATASAQEDASVGAGATLLGGRGTAGGAGQGTEPGPDSSNAGKGEPFVSRVGSSLCAAASREREEEYSRLNGRFTRALREFVRREEGLGRGTDGKEAPGVGSGGGGGGSKPPFVYVSTPEVLPRGFSGGQAGAVALLEEHLSLARKRIPGGGYAVRALHLACQTLRQPTVCVKGGRAAAAAAAADDDHHPEVVGLAGFVWEILRS